MASTADDVRLAPLTCMSPYTYAGMPDWSSASFRKCWYTIISGCERSSGWLKCTAGCGTQRVVQRLVDLPAAAVW